MTVGGVGVDPDTGLGLERGGAQRQPFLGGAGGESLDK